jgi:hypothetical protein
MGGKKPGIERFVFSKCLELGVSQPYKHRERNNSARGQRTEKRDGVRNCGNQQAVDRQNRCKKTKPPE